MKRLLLLVAVTTGALALMFGHADAVVVTFFDDDSNLPSSFNVELSTPLPPPKLHPNTKPRYPSVVRA